MTPAPQLQWRSFSESLQLDKDMLVDRSHGTLAPARKDGKPCTTVAKLHYFQNCAESLTQARARGAQKYNRMIQQALPRTKLLSTKSDRGVVGVTQRSQATPLWQGRSLISPSVLKMQFKSGILFLLF